MFDYYTFFVNLCIIKITVNMQYKKIQDISKNRKTIKVIVNKEYLNLLVVPDCIWNHLVLSVYLQKPENNSGF